MSKTHGKPEEGASCLCTWDDIDEETYCEYQTAPSMLWYPAKYSAEVVQELIDTQFKNYVDNVQKSDCARELRRLLTAGPPIWVSDKNDQKRIMTPKEAISLGADHLVIGRPITESKDPRKTAKEIVNSIR